MRQPFIVIGPTYRIAHVWACNNLFGQPRSPIVKGIDNFANVLHGTRDSLIILVDLAIKDLGEEIYRLHHNICITVKS